MAILYSSSTGSGTHNGSAAVSASARIEARRRAYQAGSNVDTPKNKIRWMRLSGVPTDTSERTLRTMFKIRDQTIDRFKSEASKDH